MNFQSLFLSHSHLWGADDVNYGVPCFFILEFSYATFSSSWQLQMMESEMPNIYWQIASLDADVAIISDMESENAKYIYWQKFL